MKNDIQNRAVELGRILSSSEFGILLRCLRSYPYDSIPEDDILSLLKLLDVARGYALVEAFNEC